MPEFADFTDPLRKVTDDSLWNLMVEADLPSLRDGPRQPALVDCLNSGLGESALEVPNSLRPSCLSGLWLLAGDIDRSHTISQDLPSREGSFLHGIMHRREGDFGNAKYWFRRVGDHPVFEQLSQETQGVYDDPFDFVDACSNATADNTPSLRQAQWLEWQALMCYIIDEVS